MSPAPIEVRPRRAGADRRGVLFAAIPYAVFAVLALVSWGRWIEPYVDTGRELETPWRISRGEALYREVRFYHGPLAPYLAAAVDRAAGPSLPARVALAGVVALANLEVLRRLAARGLSPGRAALATSVVVAACFFQRPGGCHLFPFSLDTAIAAAAGAAALLAASGRQSVAGDRLAALALLAAFLARPEMGAVAAVSLALERRSPRRFLAPVLLPFAVAGVVYAALSRGVPLATLRREGWLAVVGPPQTFRNIYAAYAGLDRPALRLTELLLAAVVLILFACAVAATAAIAARAGRAAPAVEVAGVAAIAFVAAACLRPPASLVEPLALFPPIARVVPFVVVAAALLRLAARVARRPPSAFGASVPDAVLYLAALFAARLLLAAGYVGPYSAFLLPLPLLVALAETLRLADRGAGAIGARLPRVAAAAIAVFLAFRAGDLARGFRRPGWARVGTPAGAFWLTEPVATATRDALGDLTARVPAGGTLTGFPEAGFFNYVLRLANPLPEDQFFPGHLDAGAEATAIARLAQRPPDAILYANVLAVGHGAERFGRDYLRALDGYVRDHYPPAAAYGPGAGPSRRIGDPQFFVEIRVPAAAEESR